ncbi:MAG: 2-C-methyl-D-erythritol 4-phosphate cytidylyltransferase, partial [Salaquimonas sp.]
MTRPKDETRRSGVIIVAAGRGSRMGNQDGPKQYLRLDHESVLQKTIAAFQASPLISVIQVVIHKDDLEPYKNAIGDKSKLLPPVFGGATRQLSSFAGLQALACHSLDTLLIHDAARPFVDALTIENTLRGIGKGICCVPAIAVADTIKQTADGADDLIVKNTVSRKNLYLAQTPQGFLFDEILIAHSAAHAKGKGDFTDDAAVGEAHGMQVQLVEGNRNNIKITTADDLEYLKKMNKLRENSKVPDVRTGNGYDVHRLVAGDGVILCGLKIPFDRKLDGHSDADVALHALTDALLGTIGCGDIGSHFPPSDPQWKGTQSDQFLA